MVMARELAVLRRSNRDRRAVSGLYGDRVAWVEWRRNCSDDQYTPKQARHSRRGSAQDRFGARPHWHSTTRVRRPLRSGPQVTAGRFGDGAVRFAAGPAHDWPARIGPETYFGRTRTRTSADRCVRG